jgi:hypothetical protein
MDRRAFERTGLMVVAAVLGAAVITGGMTMVEEPRNVWALRAGSTFELQVTGVAGVPSDAAAVVLNMTAVNAQAPGFATVFPCGQSRPEASNLNYAAGQTIPNLVIAKPGAGGKVCIYSYATIDVLADVSGFFPAGSAFTPISNPTRVLDTRNGVGVPVRALGAGSTLELQVTGVAGVPSDAAAVVLNMTAVNAQAPGFATVFPCGQSRPEASNLNYAAGQTIPNLVIAKPGAGGKVCIYSYATIDVLADVSGFFPAGSAFTPISNPTRVLDTRIPVNCENPPESGVKISVETDLAMSSRYITLAVCGIHVAAAAFPDGPKETLLVAYADPERLSQRFAELSGSPIEEVRKWVASSGAIAYGDTTIFFNVGHFIERKLGDSFIFNVGAHEWYHNYTVRQFVLGGLPDPVNKMLLHEPVWMLEATAQWFGSEQASIYGYAAEEQFQRAQGAEFQAPRFTDLKEWETNGGLQSYQLLPYIGDLLVKESSRTAFLRTYWEARARTTEPWQNTFQKVFGIDVPTFYAKVKQHMIDIAP